MSGAPADQAADAEDFGTVGIGDAAAAHHIVDDNEAVRAREPHGPREVVCVGFLVGIAEVYGAEVSKQTITMITDRVMEGMTEWQARPLDPA